MTSAPVRDTVSSSIPNDFLGATMPHPIETDLAADPSVESRELIQDLHDELRADIPNFKIMGKSLLSAPWSQKRVDRMATRVDAAVDARIDARIEAIVAAMAVAEKSTKVRRAAAA